MRKMLVLTTLLFGLLLAGCSEDSNNNGSQAGNGGGDTGLNTTPGLSIKASYSGTTATFNADLYGTTLGEGYNFKWDFGDSKGTATTANPTYQYSSEGQYTVTVSITDKDGNEVGSAILMVNINLSGKIVDETLTIAGNVDPLTFTLETKARSDDGAPLVYTWTFEENMAAVEGGNIMTHTYSKYGATYNSKLRVENKISGDNFEKTIEVTTKKPNFTISCTSSGLTATCRPVIDGMPNGFEDAIYTWSFGGVQRTTTGNEPATYTFDSPGTKEISVSGKSSKVEGDFLADTQVSFSNQISLGTIECAETGVNLLEYKCSVPVTVAEDASSQTLTYTWNFNGQTPTTVEENSATYAFAKFPPTNNPSYPVSVTVGFASGSQETASTNRRINITHPTVSIARGSSSSSTGASFDAILSHSITGANYRWIITGPNSFNKQVEGVDKTNTGNIEMPYEGTYTANLTVSHGSFAQNISAEPLQATISAAVEDATFTCTKVNGMTLSCSTGARGYATVNGQRQEVPLEYQWTIARGDGNENYGPTNDAKFTQSTFSQTLQKYNGTYYVSLTVKPQGTNKIVAIPRKTYNTDHMSIGVSGPATVAKRGNATFTANFSGQIANIQPKDVTYKWFVNGVNQNNNNSALTHTFDGDIGIYRVKVEASASNFGSTLSAETTIEVLETTILPEHIQDVSLNCTEVDPVNDIKKQCTATIQLSTSAPSEVRQSDMQVHIIPRNPRNNQSYDPVVFEHAQQKYVVFDWPFVNIASISNREEQRIHNAKYGIEVYHKESGKRIKVLSDKQVSVKIPKVSYELAHQAQTANNKIGSGAIIKLQSIQAPFGGGTNWTWQAHFKGLNGNRNKSFALSANNTHDLKQLMADAKFAGTVHGNPFNLESGFGVKIEGTRISRPLYLYGVNTAQGKTELGNKALGTYLGIGYMSPEGVAAFEGYNFRDMVRGTYIIEFGITVDDVYELSGWSPFCTIGSIGYINGEKWLYTLPEAKRLVVKTNPKKFYGEFGNRMRYITENRQRGVAQGGVPAMPKETGTVFSSKNKGEQFDLKYTGFRGLHLGIMLQNNNLQTCTEVMRFNYGESWNTAYCPEGGCK